MAIMKSKAKIKTIANSSSASSLSSAHGLECLLSSAQVSAGSKNLTKENSCSIMFLTFRKQAKKNMDTFQKSNHHLQPTIAYAVFGSGANSVTLDCPGQMLFREIGLPRELSSVWQFETNANMVLCSDEGDIQFRL